MTSKRTEKSALEYIWKYQSQTGIWYTYAEFKDMCSAATNVVQLKYNSYIKRVKFPKVVCVFLSHSYVCHLLLIQVI